MLEARTESGRRQGSNSASGMTNIGAKCLNRALATMKTLQGHGIGIAH